LEYGGRSSGEILDHYGDILWTLNRWEEAKSAWQQALELEDGREGILQKLDRDHDE
jgi:predicted negative regulator of RcsB-dependent stress response